MCALGRSILQAMGLLLLGCAVLQAWPGRGFWQGMLHGRPGPLAAAVGGMAAMRQPAVLQRVRRQFRLSRRHHGYAVNLGRRHRYGRRRRLPADRASRHRGAGRCRRSCAVPGRLGIHPGSWLPWRPRHRPEQHAAAGSDPVRRAHGDDRRPGDREPARLRDKPPARGPGVCRASAGRALRSAGLAFGTASTSTVLTLWAAAMVLLGVVPIALAMLRSA